MLLIKFKNRINKIRKTLSRIKLECLFLIGLLTIIITNFTVNIKFGCYFIGIACILFSIYLDFIKKG
ncbi:hypothetical protein FDF49_10880 [Clostridium sporogenes]|nr:hypothetical protein [Clostridium sporogenes]NFE45437.1 hypothetical protein [Clostridium sporogenes]NFF16130.1 hypothetical protein [Clostridium sporogenes]NFF73679.1 hypothetical protein [Clostridium sporogenes]NFF76157.1 hypothetical protein [Clostridium sporogenes]